MQGPHAGGSSVWRQAVRAGCSLQCTQCERLCVDRCQLLFVFDLGSVAARSPAPPCLSGRLLPGSTVPNHLLGLWAVFPSLCSGFRTWALWALGTDPVLLTREGRCRGCGPSCRLHAVTTLLRASAGTAGPPLLTAHIPLQVPETSGPAGPRWALPSGPSHPAPCVLPLRSCSGLSYPQLQADFCPRAPGSVRAEPV